MSLLATQEATLDSLKHQLDVVKNFVPSGDYSSMQFADQKRQVVEITNNFVRTKLIVSAVRG